MDGATLHVPLRLRSDAVEAADLFNEGIGPGAVVDLGDHASVVGGGGGPHGDGSSRPRHDILDDRNAHSLGDEVVEEAEAWEVAIEGGLGAFGRCFLLDRTQVCRDHDRGVLGNGGKRVEFGVEGHDDERDPNDEAGDPRPDDR